MNRQLTRVITVLTILAGIIMIQPVRTLAFTFLDQVVISDDQVSLADLIAPQTDVASQWQRVVVSTSPRPGGTLSVTSAQIKLALRTAGVDPDKLDVTIPLRIEIRRPGQILLAETVRSQFETKLRKELAYPVTVFEIELVGWPAEQTIRPGTVKLVITEDSVNLRDSLFRSYASFAYEIQVDGEIVDSGRARVRISAATEVPVLIRDLPRNTVVTRSDVEMREVDLTRVKAETYTSVEEVLGYRTTRLVRKGLPLNRPDLEVPPLVQYNSRVRLIGSYNGVVVETVGKALMDGRIGEVIKVENTATGRIISATVIGAGCAEALL